MESSSYLFTVDSVGELFSVLYKFWSFTFGVDIWVLLLVWVGAIKSIAVTMLRNSLNHRLPSIPGISLIGGFSQGDPPILLTIER